MRPLELVVKGFRSYAERVEIDWRDRHLVGIVGPIGSGKTSILDAVAFALYGKTPVFQTESKALIRQGSESARVELVFEAAGATWRVIRVIRHVGAGRHVLYRETGQPLTTAECEKEREVTGRIEELLGLDFPTFCRSVLLAQNRFAEFLNASPGDRDKVLKGVFGFDRLDGMQALARERRSTAALALKELEGRLATLEEDRQRLEEARRAHGRSAGRVECFEAVADEVRELARRAEKATREVEEARRRRADLEALARQLPSDAEIEEQIGAVEVATAELTRLEGEARRSREAVAEAERAREATLAEVGSAEDHARAESRLEALCKAQDQVKRHGDRRAESERERSAKLGELEQARAALEEAARTDERVRRAAARAGEALAEARKERQATEREVGDRDGLSRCREEIQSLRLARAERDRELENIRRLEDRLQAAEEDLARAASERDRAAASEERAEGERRRAADELARAEEARHQAEHTEMALTLARTLEPGKPCPVCDQTVGAIQAMLPSESLEHAGEVLEKARVADRTANARLLEVSKKAAAWRQAVENVERTRQEARAEIAASSRALARREEACREIEARLAKILGEGDPEAKLMSAEERLTKADDRVRTREEDERTAASAAREAAHALELTRQRESASRSSLAAVEKQLEDAEAEIHEASAALAEARTDVESLLGTGDPAKLLSRARARLSEAETRVASSRQAERAAARRADEGRRRVEEARQAQERLASRLAGLAGQLGHVTGAGADALTPRELSLEVRERLDEARRAAAAAEEKADDDERAARHQRGAIDAGLGLDAGADFEAALAAARAAHARDGATVVELEERLERAKELDAERRRAEARHALYVQLSDDLAASKFLRYLLEQERAALADLGSERFEMLSEGRYRFTGDGTFQVVDQHNAGAVRKADTLSGGETFLASLALALALAEKVTAGGGRLDAFFLDEGFGSLDPEHLTLAMEGIERLVTDSPNRLVTVVSHVPEMRDRIEDLIELDKDPLTGSTIVRSGAKRSS